MSDEAGRWVVEEYGPRWRSPDGSGVTLPNFSLLGDLEAAEAKAALVALIERGATSEAVKALPEWVELLAAVNRRSITLETEPSLRAPGAAPMADAAVANAALHLVAAATTTEDQPHPFTDLAQSDARMFIQWKGTDVCMDFHCRCGEHSHLDDSFAYFVCCWACGTVYELGTQVVAKVTTDPAALGRAIAMQLDDQPPPGAE